MPGSPVTIVVYNPTDLQTWDLELDNNGREIRKHLQQINANNETLRPLEINLRHIEREIKSVEETIDILEMQRLRQQQINSSYYCPSRHHHHYHNYYHNDLWQGFVYGLKNSSLTDSKNKLADLQVVRTALIAQIYPLRTAIKNAKSNAANLRGRNDWLHAHIPNARLFIEAMIYNPAQLVSALKEKFVSEILAYEKKYFVALSPQVRISLLHVHYGLDPLIENHPDHQVQIRNYLRLCGFLCDLYTRVSQENKENPFLDYLVQIINSTHVLPQGELETGYSAIVWYQTFKNNFPQLINIEQNLFEIEKTGFQQKINSLLHPPSWAQKNLHQKIARAVQIINSEVKTKVQKNEAIDYYFYTRILDTLFRLQYNPADIQVAQHLLDMVDYTSGASSVNKQVLGSLLVVAGVLLAAASIALFATTFGTSALLSAWGFALGLSMMQTQIVVGVGCSLTAAAGAGLTLWGGRTIKSGTRKGLSQELLEIQIEANNQQGHMPPAYTPTPTW
jgi:predicted phage tail protein